MQDYLLKTSKYMYQLQQDGMLCDAKLDCCDGEVLVHKIFLMSCNSVYLHEHALMGSEIVPYVIPMKDFSMKCVCNFVQGLYTGQFYVSRGNVLELLDLFSFLGVNKFLTSLQAVIEKISKLKLEVECDDKIQINGDDHLKSGDLVINCVNSSFRGDLTADCIHNPHRSKGHENSGLNNPRMQNKPVIKKSKNTLQPISAEEDKFQHVLQNQLCVVKHDLNKKAIAKGVLCASKDKLKQQKTPIPDIPVDDKLSSSSLQTFVNERRKCENPEVSHVTTVSEVVNQVQALYSQTHDHDYGIKRREHVQISVTDEPLANLEPEENITENILPVVEQNVPENTKEVYFDGYSLWQTKQTEMSKDVIIKEEVCFVYICKYISLFKGRLLCILRGYICIYH